MAGTATAFDPTKIIIGPGQIWVVPSPPGAGAYFDVATDGTPTTATYPTAKHLGHTDAGAKFKDGVTFQDFFADENPDPILSKQTGGQAELSGSLLQGADTDLLVLLTPGRGTKFTATGKEGITGGNIALAYNSIVLIFPEVADATKFHIIQLYKAFNSVGIDLDVSRKNLGKIPFNFKGLAITSRAAADTTYAAWKMV